MTFMLLFLQAGSPLAARSSGNYFIPVIVIIGIVAALSIYNNYVNRNSEKTKTRSFREKPGIIAGSTDRHEIKRITSSYGLSKEQADYFHHICKTHDIKDPSFLLQNVDSLDKLFSKVYHQLNESRNPGKETEARKTLLFTIRETIESKRRMARLIHSTKSLQTGQVFSFYTKSEEQYPSHIIENTVRGMLCEVPRDVFHNEIRLPLWSTIDLFFYTKAGQSYRCSTRIIGYESGKGANMMLLGHTDRVNALPNRRHSRRNITTVCTFCHVTVETIINGKHSEHRYYPSNKFFDGSMNDISVGGCSLTTITPPKSGEYIQIEFSLTPDFQESVVGKIIKLNKIEGKTAIAMHIQFVKMKRASMNRIFSYIYNYGES